MSAKIAAPDDAHRGDDRALGAGDQEHGERGEEADPQPEQHRGREGPHDVTAVRVRQLPEDPTDEEHADAHGLTGVPRLVGTEHHHRAGHEQDRDLELQPDRAQDPAGFDAGEADEDGHDQGERDRVPEERAEEDGCEYHAHADGHRQVATADHLAWSPGVRLGVRPGVGHGQTSSRSCSFWSSSLSI